MKFKTAVVDFLKGMVIGVANVIPGVSGGTMAVIMNIYDMLIAILSLDIPTIKKKWKEAMVLLLGMGVGILALSFIMELLLERFPTQCNWFFAGIVIGSVPFIFKKSETSLKKLNVSRIISFVIPLAVMIIIFIFNDTVDKEGGAVLTADFGTFMYMILAGLVAAFCMIVPGISGSFMLVVIGVYATVISIVNTAVSTGAAFIASFDTSLLSSLIAPAILGGGFALGVLAGLFFGAKLIKFLLARFHSLTYLAILGLVIGSVPFLLGWDGLILVAVISVGAAVSLGFSKTEEQ